MNQVPISVKTAVQAAASRIQDLGGRLLDGLAQSEMVEDQRDMTEGAFPAGLPHMSHIRTIDYERAQEVQAADQNRFRASLLKSSQHKRRSRNSSEEDEDTKLRDMVST